MTRSKVAFILVSFIAILCLLLIPGQYVRTFGQPEVLVLDNGWRISLNGTVIQEDNPQKIVRTDVRVIKKGDVLTMSRTLPSGSGYYYPSLYIRTQGAALDVLIDGMLYYSHDKEAILNNTQVESGSHFIDLPMSIAGSTLTINLYAGSSYAFLGVEPPVLSSYRSLMEYELHLNFLPLMVSIFLCVYGVSFLVISLYFVLQTPNLLGQVVSSLICIDVGIWMLSAYDLLSIIMGGHHATRLESITLYLLIPLLYLYLSSMRKPFRKQIYTAIAVISSAVCVMLAVGIAINMLPIHIVNIPFALIALLATILVLRIRFGARAGAKREESESLRIAGLLVLIATFWL
ncbi:MAG: hypothetical protein IJR58_01510, partial [Lachnospiraceae bacterium]|nr:hypothetical protein [Lachnospiraceae bacterium]